MSTNQPKITRSAVLAQVVRHLKDQPNYEGTIPSSEIAEWFNVTSNTVDYHIRNLVSDGELIISNKKAKYNRKIYQLAYPEDHIKQENKPKTKKSTSPLSQSELDNFRKILAQKVKETHTDQSPIKEEQSTPVEPEPKELPPVTYTPKQEKELPVVTEKLEMPSERKRAVHTIHGLSIEDRIQNFLSETKKVPTANQLLDQEDKEIIAVMNETIQQNMVYLNDLKETMNAFGHLQLLQSLIDERNKLVQKVEEIQGENQALKQAIEGSNNKYNVYPEKVRHMQQNLIFTVESYLDNTNAGLAINRKEFESKIVELINDFGDYAININNYEAKQ